MAQVKFFKFDADGYQAELDSSADEISALSVTAGTGGASVNGSLDVLDNQISNVPIPTEPHHIVNKEYADAIAAGLDLHDPVVVKTDEALGKVATIVGYGGSGRMDSGTASLYIQMDDDVSPTFITQTNPGHIANFVNTINTVYGSNVASRGGIWGNNLQLDGTIKGKKGIAKITNASADMKAAYGINSGGTTRYGSGLDATGSGVGKTLTAWTSDSASNTIDGVLLEVNDRVFYSNGGGDDTTPDVDNGIYKVTALGDDGSTKFELTRTTDCDEASSSEFHYGTYVLVTEGTLGASTGWSCATDVVTVDTTENVWVLFSGAPGWNYDQGLIQNVTSVKVDLDTAADGAGAGEAGGSSGLEFSVDSASGKLRVRVSPTGGIDRLADGIGLDLDGSTVGLDVGGAGTGASVKGVPSTFEINGSAVSANVTHTALGVMTAGVSSDADAYHTHDVKSDSDHTHAHGDLTSPGVDDHHAQSHTHGDSSLAHSVLTGQGTDDHHAQSHVLDGGDHSVSGLTAGDVLRAASASTFGFSTLISDHSEFDATVGSGGVTKGDPVFISANGTVLPCDNTDNNTRRFCGVALETKAQGETVRIQQDGKMEDVTVGGSPSGGDLVYLNSTNGLTVTLPTGSGTHRQVIGKVIDDTGTPDIVIEPQYLGKVG